MNGRRNLWAFATVVLCLCAAGGLYAGGAGESVSVNTTGLIEYMEGEVTLNGEAARIGLEVEPGSTVRTGSESYCEVIFQGRNIFQIQEDSTAVISIDASSGGIELERGSLAAVFKQVRTLGAGGDGFQLKTPVAVAGVRGTAFFIKAEDGSSTYVCTCNGTLELEDVEEGNRLRVRSEHHTAYRFSTTDTGIRRIRAPLLYHNDSDLDRLATKIRTAIDWGEGGYGY